VVILSCNDFIPVDNNESKKNNQEKQAILCSSIVNELVSYLGITDISIHCGSVRDDFLLMMNAPCLISSGSSLSYLAALTNENIMITPNYLHLTELYYRDNWIILPSEELPHDDVVDYDDTPTIISQLHG